MSVNMLLLLILALLANFVFPHNIDIANPIVYKDPDRTGPFNDFGYSVSLKRNIHGTPPFNLYVGAPNTARGRGSVYRCTNPSSCKSLKIPREKHVTPRWLGASMAAGESPSNFTVCAPRSVVRSSSDRFTSLMCGGICYNVDSAMSDELRLDEGRTFESRFRIRGYIGSVLTGFSVDYAKTMESTSNKGTNRIIGRPGRLGGVDTQRHGYRVNEELPLITYIGYSVSSGHYRERNKLHFATGAPVWRNRGKVVIFEQGALYKGEEIEGSVLGEYFGASLATGDFDGDGFDDLAVGAPHWGDVDFGKVYTYHRRNHGPMIGGQTLEGKVANAQFGHTLASADLDRDGYSDLIVSAPWEDSGVVYIYYGRRDFRKQDPAQIIQRIEPSVFGQNYRIQRFGFSLSRPVDIDDNGYPDLAIGAYKSGHAVVLRSRPVINTTIELSSYPSTLRITDNEFTFRVCVSYTGKLAPDFANLAVNMTVDARYKRTMNGPTQEWHGTLQRGEPSCTDKKISLTTHKNRNNVDPIVIDVTHSIKEGVNQGKIDAVLDRRSSRNRVSLTVPIDTNCRNFTACNAELYVDAKFGNLREENVWVVGSGDISLDLTVRNDDEPAYDTQVTIGMPVPRISLRNQIEVCKTAPDTLSLTCDVGNPLVGGRPISFKVHLDMSSIDTRSVGDSVLVFNVTKSTRSNDKKATQPIPPLKLEIKHDANVDLTGVTDKKRLHYRRMVEDAKIPVKHFYKVLKSGPSPITEAYLNIDVPTSMFEKNVSFLNISDWKLTGSYGKAENCFINDARSVDQLLLMEPHADFDDNDATLDTSGSTATNETRNPDNELLNDGHSEEDTFGNSTIGRTIFLNCSTKGVSCTRVTCTLELSKTQKTVSSLILDMTFNATSFYASDEESVNIKFHTNASVDIKWPLISNSRDTRNWRSNATTVLYSIPQPKKLAGWIIPVSIILGILLLCVVAAIMYKVGFFNRSKKLEAAKARDEELIIKANAAVLDGCVDGDYDP